MTCILGIYGTKNDMIKAMCKTNSVYTDNITLHDIFHRQVTALSTIILLY